MRKDKTLPLRTGMIKEGVTRRSLKALSQNHVAMGRMVFPYARGQDNNRRHKAGGLKLKLMGARDREILPSCSYFLFN